MEELNVHTPIEERVIQFGWEEAHWPFQSEPVPKFMAKLTLWSHSIEGTPFPCYNHSRDYIIRLAREVEEKNPVCVPPKYYILPCDSPGATNAYASRFTNWKDETKDQVPWEPYIVFAGKRIPLHPAMTRYLVGHEYGHVVQWEIEKRRGIKDEPITELEKEYAALRGMVANADYGGMRWHKNVGELFANDFRILQTGLEIEYWPHEDIPRPEEVPAVIEWWKEWWKE